jgi:hypothetical protein
MAPCDDDAETAAAFFDLFNQEDEPWRLPSGSLGLHVRVLGDDRSSTVSDATGGALVLCFSSSAAHFDFERSLSKLIRRNHCEGEHTHCMLVSDSELAWFLRTPDEADADAFAPVVALVRREVVRRRPRRLYTIGYCRGAYAAVRAGVALGADSVLAFAPQCTLCPSDRRQRSLPTVYYDGTLDALAQASVPLESLASVLMRSSSHGTRIALHVGADDACDVRDATLLVSELEQSGCPIAVAAHVHPDCGHEVPMWLKRQQLLVPLLQQWLLHEGAGGETSVDRTAQVGAVPLWTHRPGRGPGRARMCNE